MNERKNPIVVGIDGSPESATAARWAIQEARSRKADVRLVYAFEPIVGDEWDWKSELTVAVQRKRADEMVADALTEARAIAGDDVRVTGESIVGSRVRVLEEESLGAALMVLGSRHLGTIGSVLGSVGCAIAARAACPVVVHRGPGGDGNAAVVVGVDGSEHSAHVLRFALDYASRQDLPVRVVLCWHPHPLAQMGWVDAPTQEQQTWATRALDECVERVAGEYPSVTLEKKAVLGNSVSTLVDEAHTADLLVVGARGRHAIAGTLLGSVSQGVLHHADCPVAVVHAPREQ